VGIIIFALVAVAGLAAAGVSFTVFSGRAKAAQDDLDAARDEHRRVAEKLTRNEADLAALATERDELVRVRDTMVDERDRAWATVGEQEQRRVNVEAQNEELRALLDDDVTKEADGKEADGCWALLLADVARRWAAVVGVPPEGRGVHLGAVADQLGEALTRETDRLREEVGVDISLKAEASIEPQDPVLFLLAATDLLNLLATGCQQVALTLDGALTITGTEWVGTPDELEEARERVLSAGASVEPLEIAVNVADPEAEDAAELKDLTDGFLPTGTRETYEVRIAVHP
jgi:hypothetical protein